MGTTVIGRLMFALFRCFIVLVVAQIMMVGTQCAFAQNSDANSTTGFPPLDLWKHSILAGDAASLKALYSADPAAEVEVNGLTRNSDADINFWLD